jgi:hypothetical protein
LTDLLIDIGHNLLLRTRYGGNEIFVPDDRTHVVAVLDPESAGDGKIFQPWKIEDSTEATDAGKPDWDGIG